MATQGVMRALWLVSAVGLVGCKSEAAATAKPTPPVQPAASATEAQDAMWALAPRDAKYGIVVSPHGVALLERGWLAVQDLLASSPDFAAIHDEVMGDLLRELGTAHPTLAGLGLTHDRGGAMFLTMSNEVVVIIPVGDRNKFLAAVHGKPGVNEDELQGGVCKTLSGLYVCGEDREMLSGLGHGDLAAVLRTAGTRGDLEFAIHGGAPVQAIAFAADLGPGSFVVRGTATGVPRDMIDRIGAPSRPRSGSAGATGFGVLDVRPYVGALPPVRITASTTLADLGRTIAGPVTFVIPPDTADLGIRVPLRDPGPAQAAVAHCTDLPALTRIGATVRDGMCHLPVPQTRVAFDAWVEGNELRIGDRTAARPATVAPSALAGELARDPWSVALFGRGIFLDLSQLPAFAGLRNALPQYKLVLRALPLLNELGLAVRKDGDALHFVVGVRTIWANPDDVVHKLLAISPDDMLSGKAAELAASIAGAAPGSPFAQDYKAGLAGMLGLAAPIGIIAAVGTPAVMDQRKRSKKSQAALQLYKLGSKIEIFYMKRSEFPRGHAALTPPTTCCGQPDNLCMTSLDDWRKNPVWAALAFEDDLPSLFRYSYDSDGKTFTARAVGDLDCDGIEITYELKGKIDPATHKPVLTLTEPPPGAD